MRQSRIDILVMVDRGTHDRLRRAFNTCRRAHGVFKDDRCHLSSSPNCSVAAIANNVFVIPLHGTGMWDFARILRCTGFNCNRNVTIGRLRRWLSAALAAGDRGKALAVPNLRIKTQSG